MKHRVYIAASNQPKNMYANNRGNEQINMHTLSDMIMGELLLQDNYTVFRNKMNYTLENTVLDCNSKVCDLFIDNHSNAGGNGEGTEVFYYGQGGMGSDSYKLASLLYKHIAPLSEGKDRGVKADTSLYKGGLYVIQETKPPAVLIEHFFHDNNVETSDFFATMQDFAKAEAKAIVEYFGETWKESETEVLRKRVEVLEDRLFRIKKVVNSLYGEVYN
jgi:hypothetical protein